MNEISEIIQSPLFAKQKKRLHKNQIKTLDDAVRKIVQNQEIGSLKVGDLSGIRVFKFKSLDSIVLLAYEIIEGTLFLYTFGTHENFYRQLKKYIDR